MAILNTFDPKTTEEIFKRLEKLNYMSKPQWGKMNVAQMLAHLNVTYDLAYNRVQSPVFIISNERDFEKEKSIFIDNVKKTEADGVAFFEGRISSSFGPMTAKEWSTQFYKHIDHHFTQFGV